LLAPAGTPRPIIDRLNAEANKAMNVQEIRSYVANNGLEIIGGSPEQFGAHIKAEIARFSAIAKAANIRLD
ncbi:MAG TPA: tripartite tricarboxylate transporter substrate-binding protein, partial [Burkholderiales bacterium]|nr:tripartite tricarboxylate transporter substrate-binding protein [Burkholderiales bacterium]